MKLCAYALWGILFYCVLRPTMQGGCVATDMLVALWKCLPVCMSI